MGLEMKYFVLKPTSKIPGDKYAEASREAMRTYAYYISSENPQLANDLRRWVNKESEKDPHVFGDNKQRE